MAYTFLLALLVASYMDIKIRQELAVRQLSHGDPLPDDTDPWVYELLELMDFDRRVYTRDALPSLKRSVWKNAAPETHGLDSPRVRNGGSNTPG